MRFAGTAGTGQSLHALRIDLISGTSHAAAGARPECHSSGYGGGIEARQPGLIAGERIGFFRIGVRSQPAAQEEFRNTFGQRRSQLLDFPILWGRQRLKLRMAIVIFEAARYRAGASRAA